MKQLIKRFEAFGTTEIQKDSGHPIRVTTLENEKVVKEMICSQEDPPGTHVPSKKYCQGIKDLTIFCTENDQKKKNKTIQTSQNALHK